MTTVIPALDAFPPSAITPGDSAAGNSTTPSDAAPLATPSSPPPSDTAQPHPNSTGGPAPQFAGYLIGHLGGRRAYHCVCGRPVFFQNSVCVNSGHALGYEIESAQVRALAPGLEPGTWQLEDQTGPDEPVYRYCSNLDSPVGCNWLVRQTTTGNPAPTLCLSCGLNRMIPDLNIQGNGELWRKIELAKRRLVATLVGLDLPVRSRLTVDPQRGLAFDFLQTGPVDRVMTGHDEGVITLNIDEADDAKREAMRTKMHEPYRTLLGHLRHEVGHYYWDVLIDNSPWLDTYRPAFRRRACRLPAGVAESL